MADDLSVKTAVIEALSTLPYAESGDTLLDAHVLEGVDVTQGKVTVTLAFPADTPKHVRWDVEDAVTEAAEKVAGVSGVAVKAFLPASEQSESPAPSAGGSAPPPQRPAQAAAAGPKTLEGVGRVIAVASGKGGVGKSTVAVNLALALARLGFRTSLLDIDVYGPSLPTLLGINERPSVRDKRIIPLEAHGLRVMSLGFLMEDDAPVIWRGPIVTGIVRQFLQDVDWSGTDYLVVDMPPGTGDAQLSLAQAVPVDGAVVVTTPSELALIDAARGLHMFETLNVPVLGIVENMAYQVWEGAEGMRRALAKLPADQAKEALAVLEAHERTWIFGEGGGRREATRLKTELLGEIPLDGKVRAGGDSGKPILVGDPDSRAGQAFLDLAQKVVERKPLEGAATTAKKSVFSFLKG